MVFIERSLNLIDTINRWAGRIISYAALIMMTSVTYEVVARYFFNRPTIWSMEINQYLLCAYIALAGGYTALHGAHVNVEILYERFSVKARAVIDLLTSAFFFLLILVLIWKSGMAAYDTFIHNEVSDSLLSFPLFPSKVTIPLGAVLILLQVTANLIRNLLVAFGKTTGNGMTLNTETSAESELK